MEISLVIPAFNEEVYLGDTLDAAIQNSRGKFKEIIVVDNASTDRTREIAALRPGVTVVREARKGTNNARQTGFEHTNTELVAFIDADTRLPEGWVEKAERVFIERPDVVMLSGPARYFDAPWYVQPTLRFIWWFSGFFIYPIVGYMVLGGNCVARSNAIKAIGGFDRSITFYGDDTNLAERLSKVGKVLFRLDFFIGYSARRFVRGGLIKTSYTYATNYLWHVFFRRPLTKTHQDIR